jgi:FAD dependent oxidoreductase TIGR03364
MKPLHVVVIGAGIAGLASGWAAARRGHRVTIVERSPRASGASVRNFGMIWPIGQPAGSRRALALEGRSLWSKLAAEAGLWLNPCGAAFAAHDDDEMAVLRELEERAALLGVECSLLDPEQLLARAPGVNPESLRGGLYSPHEAGVNPPEVIAQVGKWLETRYDVAMRWRTVAVGVATGSVSLADGSTVACDRVMVCGGTDVDSLFPAELRAMGLRMCRLHMMSTAPQPGGFRIGPHLASGLSLRHYPLFQDCPSLPALRARVASNSPELDRFGIHAMASQTHSGEVLLGDSHEYDDDIGLFNSAEIDRLLERELRRVFRLPDWQPRYRWTGCYAKHPTLPYVVASPLRHVHLFTGLGGGGMTLALAAAEREWQAAFE